MRVDFQVHITFINLYHLYQPPKFRRNIRQKCKIAAGF